MALLPTYNLLGDGPLVLLLHGSAGGFRSFAPQVETLASQGWRAAAWSMPGYGHSAPLEPYSFKGLAERCAGLIEHVGASGSAPFNGCALVGQGMGGMVALEVALRRPDLVRQLVLSASAPAVQPGGSYAKHIAPCLEQLDASNPAPQLADKLVRSTVGSAALEAGVQLAGHCARALNWPVWRRALQAMQGFDRRSALAQLHTPTLCISGAQDPVAPAQAWAGLPQAQQAQLAGVGHQPNLEDPDGFDALLLDFLSQTRPSTWH